MFIVYLQGSLGLCANKSKQRIAALMALPVNLTPTPVKTYLPPEPPLEPPAPPPTLNKYNQVTPKMAAWQTYPTLKYALYE